MPQIDPKFTFWFGVWTNVLLLVASLGVDQAPHVVAQYAPIVQWFCMTFYKINNAILTALVGLSSTQAGPLIKLPPPSMPTIVKVLILAFLPLVLLAGHLAQAAERQRPRLPAVTGDIAKDIRTDLGISDTAGVKKNADGSIVCDFNIFLALNPKNLVQVIKACVTSADSTLIQDTQIALQSAQNFQQMDTSGSTGAKGDTPAIQCLQPGLAILQAALPRPAVEAVAAQPATATTPAVPAVDAQPAYNPGLITLFQKYREFELVGGPAACQNWVNSTVNGAVGPAVAGVAGLAAGAAVLAPK